MSHLVISKKNEVYLYVDAEVHIYYELADQFTFEVPGAKAKRMLARKVHKATVSDFIPKELEDQKQFNSQESL